MARRTRSSAGRLALIAATGVAAAVLLSSGLVAAAPDTGAVETPGTPPGKLVITTPGGPVDGKIAFCVESIRVDTAAGPVAQSFMLKFDDFGVFGIGPYTPTASGSLCGTVSTIPADHAAGRGGAADKLPADLCDTSKPHTLRLLSGTWGAPEGTTPPPSQRSISSPISVAGDSCGAAIPGGTGGEQPDPGGSTPPGTTTPGTATTPTTGAPGSRATPAAVTLRSATLSVRGRSVYVRVTGGKAFVKGSALLRTRDKVAMGRSKAVRWTLAKQTFQVAAGNAVELRLSLTPNGRKLMRTRLRLAGVLTLTPDRGGAAVTRDVTVRRPKTSKN